MRTLRALIVEDSEDDTDLLVRELRRCGYETTHARVQTSEAMSRELAAGEWDIIFSDFTMPQFNAFDALDTLHRFGLDLPFIIVSGTIGEDRAVLAMKAGAHDYILKGNLKRLAPAVDRELREAGVRRERRAAEQTILRLAYSDPVTELPNRVHFSQSLSEAILSANAKDRPLALLLMDLDRFQEVNDTLGHLHGDHLLREISQRLRALLAPNVVARLGGDEFGVLLPNYDVDAIDHTVKTLQQLFQQPVEIEGIPIAVEASIGVAIMPDHASDAEGLMQRAEIAMYRAKRLGQGHLVYDENFDGHSTERLRLMAELRDAIDREELILHYQPKVETETNRISGVEALVRWRHPRRGLLLPDQFISDAEYTGLLAPLTHWVLSRALSDCASSIGDTITDAVSVNLSARSLHHRHLCEVMATALRLTGADPRQLTLEITESAIVLDPHGAQATLEKLSAMGIRISIDDFGTGYTSLASIRHLPVDEIKIDRLFVTNMLDNRNDAMIVRSVIELGHNLGIRIVAEGVETREVADVLTEWGCDELQGYFICRPTTYDSFVDWALRSPKPLGDKQ